MSHAEGNTNFGGHRQSLEGLPPSAKLVAWTLAEHGELSPGNLAEETLLPVRTVRYAVKQLDEAGVIQRRVDLTDSRRTLYSLQAIE